MSSIDKYVVTEAKKYDSRVQVENSNGYITGRINGEVVFRIQDRYGYLNDSEEAKIRSAMTNYQNQERIRREQEERMRRLREEQRQQEIANARSSIARKEAELERAILQARQRSEAPQITYNRQVLNGFNLGKLDARIAEARRAYTASFSENERKYENAKANLARIKSTIASCATAEEARRRQSDISRIQCNFSLDSSAISEINKLKNEVSTIESSARTITSMLAKLKNTPHDDNIGSKITRIVNSISSYDITSAEDVKGILQRIESALVDIKVSEAGKISADMEKSLNAIDAAIAESKQLQIQIEQATYEVKSFEQEIEKEREEIRNLIAELRTAEYTTCTEEVFARMESFLEESNGATEEHTLELAQKHRELCTRVLTEDETYHLAYEIYKKAMERLSERMGGPVIEEQVFDIRNGKQGVLNQLQRLCDIETKLDLQAAKATADLHISVAHDVMTKMGYSLVKSNVDAEVINVSYYTKKGWDGVVMQIIATEHGVERKLIGVSINGQRTSPEQIKKIAEELEKEREPINFLHSMNENKMMNCKIRANGDVTTSTENVIEYIQNDVTLDLSGNEMVKVGEQNMTEWERFKNITQTGDAKIQETFVKATNDCKSSDSFAIQYDNKAKKNTVSNTTNRYQSR